VPKVEAVVNIQQINDLINEYCTPEWRTLMEQHREEVAYPRDALVFQEGQEAKRIKVIKTGKAKVYTTYKTGREQILRLAADGQVLGHRGLGGDQCYPASCKTLVESVVYHIPIDLFHNVLKANHLFCYHFMMFFAEELRVSDRQLNHYINRDVRQRMASALIYNLKVFGFSQKNQNRIGYTLSRKDFASLVGTTYESVVRALSDFDKSGIIKIAGRHVEIHDLKALERVMLEG
jgi:CRP/FNR family transcriptional regulator